MKSLSYPQSLTALISQLTRLPSIGARGAERLALHLLQAGRAEAPALAEALLQANDTISYCPQCGFFAEQGSLCTACQDSERDSQQLCVVEQATDVLPIERCGMYKGLYHCLGGKISPLDGIMPEDLRITALLQRISKSNAPQVEIILALSSDVEGEATALYLAEQLKKYPCTVSRLAQGMPAGAGLGHTDAVTIMRALEGRQGF